MGKLTLQIQQSRENFTRKLLRYRNVHYFLAYYCILVIMPITLRDTTVNALKGAIAPSTSLKKSPLRSLQQLKNSLSSQEDSASIEFDNINGKQKQKHLVLVGGGHAHAQVIKVLNWASRPDNVKITLIDKQCAAWYSGMVPGCICNLYKPDDTLLRLKPLAEWAGIEFVHDRVVDIDLDQKQIYLESSDAERISFDCISIDIGSTSRGLDDFPGARQFTIPTRPISKLVERIEQSEETIDPEKDEPKVVVIGGGVAGLELSMSLHARWTTRFPNTQVTLLDANSELLSGESKNAREAIKGIVQQKGIQVKQAVVIKEICQDCVIVDINGNEEKIPQTHCIWATGASAHPLARRLQDKGLAATQHSWISVNEYLQSTSHPFVFAAGDCCNIENLPNGSPPKAGVFAVRAGPVLIENLTKFLDGKPYEASKLKKYVPQTDFMKILVCGDGKALALRFGHTFFGKWVMELKDTIDNNFVNMFKRENLPELEPGEPYDMSQYDSKMAKKTDMNPEDAANLLTRTDDDVDYQKAWGVLRTMADDEDYRNNVLSYMDKPAELFVHK